MKKLFLLLLSVVGMLDAGYLTYEHYSNRIVPCATGLFVDCGKVLTSKYSVVGGVPLALIGLVHYIALFIIAYLAWQNKSKLWKYLLFVQTAIGLVASIYFMYLQIFLIGAICLYCTVSALNSLILFFLVRVTYIKDYRSWAVLFLSWKYKYVLKNILFLINPEVVHNIMTRSGEMMGQIEFIKKIARWFLDQKSFCLYQTYAGIKFSSPIGLSAGFDYEARLTQILPTLGFGFQSVGTITNFHYEGNPPPMLGRLPKSQSLMVNKGFKNKGAKAVIQKLKKLRFEIPVGISIGRTNTANLDTVKKAIEDIASAFQQFEESPVEHSYYELNISCPNLHGAVSFYPSENLTQLLKAVDKLCLKRPVLIKMPIEKSNQEFLDMLSCIEKHTIAGIIIGNLQKDKKDPAFDKNEVKRWKKGGFSGKPTERRSNELISLAYKKWGKKILIIGCGGVFSAEDAYEKIKRGASLVQLITGMIYNGPQLIAQINSGLEELLLRDGYKSITEAIGRADG